MIPKNGNPILWEELTWKDVDKLTKTMNMEQIIKMEPLEWGNSGYLI